jgi:hypothetical protein
VLKADRADTLPTAVVEAFAAAIAFVLPAASTVLELNVDLSRVSQSLRERPFQVERLLITAQKAKNRDENTLEADRHVHIGMKSLPYDDGSFDGIYSIEASNVLLECLSVASELKRLLKPNSVFINATSDPVRTDISNNMDVGWDVILKRNHLQRPELPDAKARRELDSALRESGAIRESIPISRWTTTSSPRRRLVATAAQAKLYKLPDDMFQQFMRDYERWLKAQYTTIDAPIQLVRETSIHVWRWK